MMVKVGHPTSFRYRLNKYCYLHIVTISVIQNDSMYKGWMMI